MQIAVIEDVGGFRALGREWDTLLATSRQDCPFLRHGWLYAWWNSYGGTARPAIVTCREEDSGRLLGVLPAYRVGTGTVMQAARLRLLGDARVGSSGLGAFVCPDAEDEVFDALSAHLHGPDGDWDVLDFRVVDTEAPFFRTLLGPGRSAGVRRGRHGRPQIALPHDWDMYLTERLGPRARSSVRHSRRLAEKAGGGIELVQRPEELPAALDDMLALFQQRMKHVLGRRFIVTDSFKRFTAEVAEGLLAAGRLRLGFLNIEGRRVAFEYQFRYLDTMYAVLGGFEEQWARLEVSRALFSDMVERAIAEGCSTLDFGLGEQPYKFGWGVTDVRRFGDITAYSDSPAARLSRVGDAFGAGLARAVESSPQRISKPLLGWVTSAHCALSAAGIVSDIDCSDHHGAEPTTDPSAGVVVVPAPEDDAPIRKES